MSFFDGCYASKITIYFPVEKSHTSRHPDPHLQNIALAPILHLSSEVCHPDYYKLVQIPAYDPSKPLGLANRPPQSYLHPWNEQQFRQSLTQVGFLVEMALAVMGADIPPGHAVQVRRNYHDNQPIPFTTPVAEIATENVDLFIYIGTVSGTTDAVTVNPVYWRDAVGGKSTSSVPTGLSQRLSGFTADAKVMLGYRDGFAGRLLHTRDARAGKDSIGAENCHLVAACRGEKMFFPLISTRHGTRRVADRCKINEALNGVRLEHDHHIDFERKKLGFAVLPNHTMDKDGNMRTELKLDPGSELSSIGARLLPLTFGFHFPVPPSILPSSRKRKSPGTPPLADHPVPRLTGRCYRLPYDLPAASPLINNSAMEPPFEVWNYAFGSYVASCMGTSWFVEVSRSVHARLEANCDDRSTTDAATQMSASRGGDGVDDAPRRGSGSGGWSGSDAASSTGGQEGDGGSGRHFGAGDMDGIEQPREDGADENRAQGHRGVDNGCDASAVASGSATFVEPTTPGADDALSHQYTDDIPGLPSVDLEYFQRPAGSGSLRVMSGRDVALHKAVLRWLTGGRFEGAVW